MDAAPRDETTTTWTGPAGSTEPLPARWRRDRAGSLVERLRSGPTRRVVAVNGRSGSGKSSLAARLQAELPGSAVVATDDIAWHFSMFDWAEETETRVLRPFRDGAGVEYRPPGWVEQGREGAIRVPADATLLILEGVGSAQRRLADAVDTAIWVASNHPDARRLGLARDVASGVNGDAEAAAAFWNDWEREEVAFLERDRAWERADLILAGVPLARSGIWVPG